MKPHRLAALAIGGFAIGWSTPQIVIPLLGAGPWIVPAALPLTLLAAGIFVFAQGVRA